MFKILYTNCCCKSSIPHDHIKIATPESIAVSKKYARKYTALSRQTCGLSGKNNFQQKTDHKRDHGAGNRQADLERNTAPYLQSCPLIRHSVRM